MIYNECELTKVQYIVIKLQVRKMLKSEALMVQLL